MRRFLMATSVISSILGSAAIGWAQSDSTLPVPARGCTAKPFATRCFCIDYDLKGFEVNNSSGSAGAELVGQDSSTHIVRIEISNTKILHFEGFGGATFAVEKKIPCPATASVTLVPVKPGKTSVKVTVDGQTTEFPVGVVGYRLVIQFGKFVGQKTPGSDAKFSTTGEEHISRTDTQCLVSRGVDMSLHVEAKQETTSSATLTIPAQIQVTVVAGSDEHCIDLCVSATMEAKQKARGTAQISGNFFAGTSVTLTRGSGSSTPNAPFQTDENGNPLVDNTEFAPTVQAEGNKHVRHFDGMGPFNTNSSMGDSSVSWEDCLVPGTSYNFATLWRISVHVLPDPVCEGQGKLDVDGLEICVRLKCSEDD